VEYTAPFSTAELPSLVIGQPDLTTNAQGSGATGFDSPWGIAFDGTGNLWVVDAADWRVLEFKTPFTNGEAASLVIGDPDFALTLDPDRQSSLSNPRELTFDKSGNLYVADGIDNRVMIFSPPFSSGMKATKVVGQPDFNSLGESVGASGLNNFVGVSIY
jgi:hypothetical protein